MSIRIQYDLRAHCVMVMDRSGVLYRVPDVMPACDQSMWSTLLERLCHFCVSDGRRGYLEYADTSITRGILNQFLWKYR
jgi:hypothetical protein